MRNTDRFNFDALVDRDVVLDEWVSHSHETTLTIHPLREPWSVHGYAAVRHGNGDAVSEEVLMLRNGDKLESVEPDDFVRFVRANAPNRLRRRGLLRRLVVAAVTALVLAGCAAGGEEGPVADDEPAAAADIDTTTDEAAADGDATADDGTDGAADYGNAHTCGDWTPATLPSGADAGEQYEVTTDFGTAPAWGEGDDRVVLVTGDAALRASGGEENFMGMTEVELTDGTMGSVSAVGDGENENAHLQFYLDGCPHHLFTRASHDAVVSWAATL